MALLAGFDMLLVRTAAGTFPIVVFCGHALFLICSFGQAEATRSALAAFSARFGSTFAIVREIAAAGVTAFLPRFTGAFRVVLEVPAGGLTAFLAGLGRPLWIISKIAAGGSTALASNLALLVFVHRSEAAV
jgi:hypothetical protein